MFLYNIEKNKVVNKSCNHGAAPALSGMIVREHF